MLPGSSARLLKMLLFAAAALGVLKLYGHARSQSEAARAFSLYEQGRLVEARRALRSALAYTPQAHWREQRLTDVLQKLDAAIAAVAERVEQPLPPAAADVDRLARARDLAMLDRVEAAFALLDSSPALAGSAAACNLRGTMHETEEDFVDAGVWYAAAADAWRLQAESSEQAAGLATALKGMAFCERKLGRLSEAESGYLQLLQHAPTAENHFLVAQFYEDVQQAKGAHFHAQEAMRLDPQRFGERGARLVDKLRTSHFGCWSISSERR